MPSPHPVTYIAQLRLQGSIKLQDDIISQGELHGWKASVTDRHLP